MDSVLIARIAAFVLYLGFMIYIGLRNMKKNTSAGDFFLGGRQVGPWVTALSAEASDMSGWLLMGLPGLAYLGGMKEAFWTAVGLAAGTYLSWLIVAKPLRKCTAAFGNAITIPEFLTNRFNDRRHLIATIMVVFNLLFFTIYVASGFVACAKLFNSVFALPYHVGLVIGLVVILAYTITGGYRAVCSTDFVQGALMFVALIITGAVMLFVLGGPAAAWESVQNFSQRAMAGEFNGVSEKMQDAFTRNQHFGAVAVISSLVWGLGYFGMPHFIVRFMGIRSAKDVKVSRRIAIVWVIIALGVAVIVGSLGTVYLPQILSTSAAETVFSESIKLMFPAFIAGIFLCAILAAAMSTADSQLLVASSSFSQDIYKGLLKKDATDEDVLKASRVAVLVIAALAFCISLNQNSSIFSLVSYAWAGFGSTIGPLILLALFWKRTTRNGALVGLIVGAVTVIVWHSLSGGIFDVYEILPGFAFCLIAAVIVSLCGKPDEAIVRKFEAYQSFAD